MSSISAIVPCYNGEAGVNELHQAIRRLQAVGGAYELIYVNDGSSDGTLARCELAAHDPHVVVVNLTRNFGHQLALSAGHAGTNSSSSSMTTSRSTELLTPMLQLIEEGADVVYGQRRGRAGDGSRASAAAFIGCSTACRGSAFRSTPAISGDAARRCVECDARRPIHRAAWSAGWAFARFRCSMTVTCAMLERRNIRFAS